MQDDRKQIQQELVAIEKAMRTLEITYEQYFAGVEKREPLLNRENLTRQIRQFANRRIMQTDLRFKYQNMATRFHSVSGYWDRILRLMDEGKYHRPTGVKAGTKPIPAPGNRVAPSAQENQVDTVYRDLLAARQACNLSSQAPEKQQVAAMLEQQRAKIREKFGDRAVDFQVETRDGKPRIVVKARK
ncbi:MAG: hypothetical protein IBX47_09115 [Desulfuromonadales bacterium]|nr:hypothetical protein [Desulfuromonadales bacterium]